MKNNALPFGEEMRFAAGKLHTSMEGIFSAYQNTFSGSLWPTRNKNREALGNYIRHARAHLNQMEAVLTEMNREDVYVEPDRD